MRWFKMNKRVLVLASRSPRRKVLLKKLCIPFIVRLPRSREHFPGKNILKELRTNTINKALSVRAPQKALIIAGDTVIVYNNRVLGKPKSRNEARDFLRSLSGKTHMVLTDIVIYDTVKKKAISAVTKTRVTFRTLTDQEITAYLDTGEYKDKAGAYGIQGHGSRLVKKVNGDIENVIGFPLSTVKTLLTKSRRNSDGSF